MSWFVVGGLVVGAVGSYASQKSTNAANAKLAKQGGHVDMTTTRTPYGPASGYLDAGGQAAYDTLFGTQYGPPIAGNPNAAGGTGAGSGAGGHPNVPAGYHVNAHGQVVPVHNPANAAPAGAGAGPAGGGTGSGLPSTVAGKSGQSAATSAIIGQMQGLPAQNAAMNNVAEQYSTNLLGGQSSNPLLSPAALAAANVGNDPRLDAFEDYLQGSLGVGSGGGSSQEIPYGQSVYPGQPGYAQASAAYSAANGGGYGGSATGTDQALRDLVAGKDPAGWAAMQKAIEDSVNSSRAESLRNLKGNAVQGGFYGGTGFDSMEAQAVASGDQQLADQLATARFGAFQNALTLGTQYDTSMADVAAKNNATAAGSASSAAATQAALRGQNLGALGSALQLGEEGRYGTATNLGSLANLFSSDQKTALGEINDLSTSRRNDLSAAGQLALGSDQAQDSRASAAMAANASRANVNSQIAWQQQQFYDPMTRLGDYTSILGGLYGGYGSQTEQGTDTRAGGGAGYTSPFGSALQGAAIGGQLGSLYNRQQQPITNSPTGPAASVYG